MDSLDYLVGFFWWEGGYVFVLSRLYCVSNWYHCMVKLFVLMFFNEFGSGRRGNLEFLLEIQCEQCSLSFSRTTLLYPRMVLIK